MRGSHHRVPRPSNSSQHREGITAVDETREDPESSLLFSAAINWSMQVVDGRRNSDHSGLPQIRWTGVPPAISIPAIHESNRSPSPPQPFNHWLMPAPPLPRGPAQVQTFSLSPEVQQIQNPMSSAPPVQKRLRSKSKFTFSINAARAMNTPTNMYLSTPPLAPLPLRRRQPIPLPSLSPFIPIQIHPVISSHSSTCGSDAPMYWNMSFPPSTARLAAALGGLAASRWSREVAVEPRTLPSVTIRIVGVARAVVVFPVEMGYPIRIVDVLRAIYRALRRAALESVYDRVVGDIDVGSVYESTPADEAAAPDAIRRHFRGSVWWGGLYESMDERDVWILELRGAERG